MGCECVLGYSYQVADGCIDEGLTVALAMHGPPYATALLERHCCNVCEV